MNWACNILWIHSVYTSLWNPLNIALLSTPKWIWVNNRKDLDLLQHSKSPCIYTKFCYFYDGFFVNPYSARTSQFRNYVRIFPNESLCSISLSVCDPLMLISSLSLRIFIQWLTATAAVTINVCLNIELRTDVCIHLSITL